MKNELEGFFPKICNLTPPPPPYNYAQKSTRYQASKILITKPALVVAVRQACPYGTITE